jgi:mxaJ protein
MSSRCLSLLLCATACYGAGDRVLRVCADPNNLPFSNQRAEGFENRLAGLVARELGARVEYTWYAPGRGYLRNSLNAGTCDIVMGIPSALDTVAVTAPYYRSTYVFVARHPGIASLDDPRLKKMRIGVQMVGDDYAPPAYALANNGLAANVVGYSSHDPAAIVDAVAMGDVDVAVVWGPFAGYFAKGLDLTPVSPTTYLTIPFTFEVSMGVRKADAALKQELDAVIATNCGAIQKLLDEYRVPREGKTPCASSPSQQSPSVGLH